MTTAITSTRQQAAHVEPDHRQQMALERLEFAISELASVVLSVCRSRQTGRAAIAGLRKATAPVVADILAAD